ncbi:GAF domain-containing protein [Marinomonas epiphytica]
MFELQEKQAVSSLADYQELADQLTGLLSGEQDLIANSAQFSAFVMQMIPDLNWSGIYFAQGEELVLGPFVGKVACTRIPFGRGVCGSAAATQLTQRVDDVHAFEGHIACDAASASELVIPIVVDQELVGVFDMDSPNIQRFSAIDEQGMEKLVAIFVASTNMSWSR